MIPPTGTAQKFAISIPAPIRQLPHGNMQRHGLYVVTQRVRLSPRINHPFPDLLDVLTRTMKTALDFGCGAALDFYCPMFAIGPAQQQINFCAGAATVETGGLRLLMATVCGRRICPRAAGKTKPVCKPQCVCKTVLNSKTRCPDNSKPLGQHSAPASTKQR